MKLLVCVCVWTVVHRVHVNPWQMFQKLPKGHPSAVCEQSEALKQSSKHVSNRKNQPKSWSHMHWPFSSIPSTPSVEKLGENPTCHTERTRTRYKNQCKIESKQCIMSSQPGVGTARTLSFHSAGLARAIPGKHFNPWSQPHPSTLAKGKTHLRLAMVGWILFFFFSPLQSWNWQSSKKAESQNLLNHKIWKSDLWIHNFSTCQLVDPQKSLILLFKFCGSTIFGIKILWIHKILKLHLRIQKILKINVFSKKIEENRGELSQFFFDVWKNVEIFNWIWWFFQWRQYCKTQYRSYVFCFFSISKWIYFLTFFYDNLW